MCVINMWSRCSSWLYFGIYIRRGGVIYPFIMSMWDIFGIGQPYFFNDLCQISVQCSLLHGWCQWVEIWHIYVHTSPIHTCQVFKKIAYVTSLVGIFIYGTYLAITHHVELAVGCVLAYIGKLMGPHVHVACWLCKLYLQYGTHTC